jgi:hypothetical protein
MFLNHIIIYIKSLYSYKIHILMFLFQTLLLYINISIFHKKKNNLFLIIAIINNILLSLIGFYKNFFNINTYYSLSKFLFLISIVNISISFYINFLNNFIKKKKYIVLYKNMICPCCVLQLIIQPFGLFLNNTVLLIIILIQFFILLFLIWKKNYNIFIYTSLLINIFYFININFFYIYKNIFLCIKYSLLLISLINIILGVRSMYIKKNQKKNMDNCCKH